MGRLMTVKKPALHHFYSPLEIFKFPPREIPSDLVQKPPLNSHGMWVDFPNELNYPLACSKTNDSETFESVALERTSFNNLYRGMRQ
jgi:hypothetical protein